MNAASEYELYRAVQIPCHVLPARTAPPGAAEERLSARLAVVPFTHGPGPFLAPLLVAELLHLLAPYRDRALHHPPPGREPELLDPVAGPVRALVAGIAALRPDTGTDVADAAVPVHFRRWLRLHASQALGLFRFRAVEIAHDLLELLVVVAGGDVDPARPAVEPAGRHKIFVLDLVVAPSFHDVTSKRV